MRQLISSGTKWESEVGYSRAVVQKPFAFVSGTTAVGKSGEVIGKGDASAQADFVYHKIKMTLEKADFTLEDVVRVRIFVINIGDFEEISKIHHKYFSNIRPVATLVEVSKFVNPDLLVEIEADALLKD